jgi:hypothetical protein
MNNDELKKAFRLKAGVVLVGHPSKLEALITDLIKHETENEVGVLFVKLSAAERLRIEESGYEDGEKRS